MLPGPPAPRLPQPDPLAGTPCRRVGVLGEGAGVTLDQEVPGVPPALDSEQHKLWTSCPDVAPQAVDAVVAELGALTPPEEMLEVAVRGTVEAAATYDAQRG